MVAKFALQSMPTFSKIEQTTDHQIRWLVCTYSHGVSAFSVEHDGSVIYKPKVDLMLALSDVSGTVIRYEHISRWGPHRLFLVGYDTGFVTASICPTRRDASDEHSPLIDRKSLKFDGPVSVLKVLRIGEKSLSVLVSSTLGPATVWTLRKNENDLQQLSWHLSTVLQESELYDAVVTGTVHRNANCGTVDNASAGVDDVGGGMVLIGTYGELLLAYDLHELLSQQDEVGPLLSINIASPILAVEQFGEELPLNGRSLGAYPATAQVARHCHYHNNTSGETC
ncbi:hypothetical protein GPALN_005206 [Globodera pallida]|nr:hypothetical protein GPALN_005206 [Globodera pallida]